MHCDTSLTLPTTPLYPAEFVTILRNLGLTGHSTRIMMSCSLIRELEQGTAYDLEVMLEQLGWLDKSTLIYYGANRATVQHSLPPIRGRTDNWTPTSHTKTRTNTIKWTMSEPNLMKTIVRVTEQQQCSESQEILWVDPDPTGSTWTHTVDEDGERIDIVRYSATQNEAKGFRPTPTISVYGPYGKRIAERGKYKKLLAAIKNSKTNKQNVQVKKVMADTTNASDIPPKTSGPNLAESFRGHKPAHADYNPFKADMAAGDIATLDEQPSQSAAEMQLECALGCRESVKSSPKLPTQYEEYVESKEFRDLKIRKRRFDEEYAAERSKENMDSAQTDPNPKVTVTKNVQNTEGSCLATRDKEITGTVLPNVLNVENDVTKGDLMQLLPYKVLYLREISNCPSGVFVAPSWATRFSSAISKCDHGYQYETSPTTRLIDITQANNEWKSTTKLRARSLNSFNTLAYFEIVSVMNRTYEAIIPRPQLPVHLNAPVRVKACFYQHIPQRLQPLFDQIKSMPLGSNAFTAKR